MPPDLSANKSDSRPVDDMCRIANEEHKPLECSPKLLLDPFLREWQDPDASEKAESPNEDLYRKAENNMLAAVVNLFEYSFLFFAAGQALLSIVNPKVKGSLYYVFILLPIALMMSPTVSATMSETAKKNVGEASEE